MWKIKQNLIDDAFQAADNFLPKEFMCFLGGDENKQEINEIVILPTYNGETFSSVNLNIMPFDKTIIGSLHSHPNGFAQPSNADKQFFKRYKINLILGNGPIRQIGFFDNKSNPLQVEIIKSKYLIR
jgi:proteasome lid subunit RPN8/RPN11